MKLDPELWTRAKRFLPGALRAGVRNPMVRPHWFGNSDRFWYRREDEAGWRFVCVDAQDGSSADAFDHDALAAALRDAGIEAEAGRLPIERLVIAADGALVFHAGGRRWRFHETLEPFVEKQLAGEVLSPDGRFGVRRLGDDLWLREVGTGVERALTTDGAAHCAYGKSPDMNLTTISLKRRGVTLPARVLWSADSRMVFTSQLDEREVGDWPLVQHVPDDGSTRPILHVLKVAHAGDAVLPSETHLVIDVVTGTTLARSGPHVVGVMTCLEKEEAWWSGDGSRVFFIDRDRISRRVALCELAVGSGEVREVFVEQVETFHDANVSVLGLPNIRILEESFIWFSQRSGWGHLYLHDLATGDLRNAITSGEWVVRDIVRVDAGCVFFLAGGLDADPQARRLCVANLDGSGFEVLTPEPGDHALAMPQKRAPRDHIRPAEPAGEWMSPSGRFFVETRGGLDRLPASWLRRRDGGVVAEIVTASLSPAYAQDWRWPTPFSALAADGETVAHGAFWLPTDFDPSRKYPVIDYIYPGPQRGIVPWTVFTDVPGDLALSALPQAFAELGFVVVKFDSRGQPLRSKRLHDMSYGRLDNPGFLEDHVAILRELARRHDFIDLGRVGIMGHSGGGYASVRAMLDYPEFFHAAVASSGNHDQRGYSYSWTEHYQGPLLRDADGGSNYDTANTPHLAHRLVGKLLLAYGDMDDNVHPALTLQLIAALIAADKDFETVVLPNDDHATVWTNEWFLRRAKAFLVEALG